MTSPGQMPNPAMLARQADDGQSAIDAIAAAVAGLGEVREMPVAEHVERFEAVHTALTDALSKADHLLSATSAHRS
ncbi:hypothetical protein SAMN02982929_02568 [Saccharopolyspora kobensis]|uniref:Uncharacterized protein n=1 Tax=Saccharopolyspora kobensis TaxID=146035 RepID=A0A1H6AYG7_9PSEU|nr:hypothetical protein [Saccharopolyspora kobensis]SEG53394.1 hypothetical protein SAMN02982929_02568 [Saccharopolyspora kobensis]SFE81458.1 hypothetical protein SAMN05216506_114176 [Saccharopolyspora kobensis]